MGATRLPNGGQVVGRWWVGQERVEGHHRRAGGGEPPCCLQSSRPDFQSTRRIRVSFTSAKVRGSSHTVERKKSAHTCP